MMFAGAAGAAGRRTDKETNLLDPEAVAATSAGAGAGSTLWRGLACMVSTCQYTMVRSERF